MTKKVNVPSTSKKAYKDLHADQVKRHHALIISALFKLKKANADKIAQHLKMDHVQINRRTSELEGLGLIAKPGTKSKTKTGREAFDWVLTAAGVLQASVTVAEYAKEILKPAKFSQTELFK